jgi:hexokinase
LELIDPEDIFFWGYRINISEGFMSDAKMNVQRFLNNYNMSVSHVSVETILKDFESEMSAGLAGNKSSLAMIASYINCNDPVPINKPVIVLDAGGTNLRVCIVSFDERGNVNIEHFEKFQMPGISQKLTKEAFYNIICDYLKSVIDKADSIGFCFSYPSEISPGKDGKLLFWTKEVKVPEVVGEYIGAGLLNTLAQRGYTDKKIVLLNDTVSCLLAGKAVGQVRQCGGYIGFILGTGTNTAYVEDNYKISKINTQEGSQVINVESGNFSKCPQGDIDKLYDAKTDNPGKQTFEKMISGRYLGDIALEVIKQAASDKMFSIASLAVIREIKCLETADLSIFIENPFNVIAPFNHSLIESNDREIIYHIILALIERAAKLAALNIAAVAIKADIGHNPLHPICINIDGSTFHKLYGFRPKCEAYLAGILNERGIYFEIIEVHNAPIIGAAIAGLVG